MTGAPDERPRRVSYQVLLELVRRAANLFAALAGRDAGVAYMLPNLVETHAALWGAETAGYAVPINFLLKPEVIATLLRASGARILVALGPDPALDIWQKAQRVRELIPEVTLVRLAAPGTPGEAGIVDFAQAMAAQPADRLVFGPARGGKDVAAYFHTGGTTGSPKLVAHTHEGQLVAAMGGALLAGYDATDRTTATLPLFHVGAAISGALSPFIAGAELLILSPTGLRAPTMVQNFWRIIERYRVTVAGAVPTGIAAVLDVPVGDADLSSLRAGVCGGASIPLSVAQRFAQVTGRKIFQVYGMTEASGVITVDLSFGQGELGSVGFPLPYTAVEIRHVGSGERCAPRDVGVVMVRGPHVSPGYRDPAHDTGTFVDGGWLDTGDLGYFDEAGRLYLAGRSKDLIIRSGHNIDPEMIENAISTHPAVAVAAAVGMPDIYAGELPVCYVALRPGCIAKESELQEHARRTIAERPAWPRRIHVVDAIPTTAVGKIYKPALRCDAAVRTIEQLLVDVYGVGDAKVSAREGGTRGMRVIVELPPSASNASARVEEALSRYLFDGKVELSG
jgi:fatty-acyl-CoA synthase